MMTQIDRIVIINDSSVAKGGATGLAVESALAFRQRGYSVTFVCGDRGENAALSDAGVNIVALGQARLLDSPILNVVVGAIYNRGAATMLADWITQFDTKNTIYHVHGWAQILSPSIFRPLRHVAGRVVLSAHDFFLVCPNGSYSFLKSGQVCALTPQSFACISADCDRVSYANKLWRVVRQSMRRLTLDWRRDPPPVLAIHEAMRGFLERGGIPANAIKTVTNPVRPFLNKRVHAEVNRGLIFIGRLESGKGPDLACAAARLANVPLTIIGDGPMATQLKLDYPEVTFCGRLPASDIRPHIAEARALVMPSRYPEPFGLVAVEAMWSGIPIIASDTAFLTPAVVSLGAGLSCVPRNAVEFASKIGWLFSDDALTKQMSITAFSGTRGLAMTYAAWIDTLLSVYQERIGQR